jgi:hypothetical protein
MLSKTPILASLSLARSPFAKTLDSIISNSGASELSEEHSKRSAKREKISCFDTS